MAPKKKRTTDKSIALSNITDALEELVLNEDNTSPSQAAVVQHIVDQQLGPDTDSYIRGIVESNIYNDVKRYWAEACDKVGKENHLPFHMTTKAWYGRNRKLPETELEATKYVAAFANGRGRSTAGVRFLDHHSEAADDLMFALYVKKRACVQDGSNKALVGILENAKGAGVLTDETVKSLPGHPAT